MSLKVSYLDFWCDFLGVPIKLEDINNKNYWNNIEVKKDLKLVDEGIGIFHKSYLEKILEKNIEIINDPEQSDLIICSIFGNCKLKYNHKKKIYLNFESQNFTFLPNTIYFSSNLYESYNYYLPLYICYYGFDLYHLLQQTRNLLTEEEFNNKYTCLTIISNRNSNFRVDFLNNLIRKKIPVDNYGKFKKTIHDNIIANSSWFDPRMGDVIKKYKFMVCMENCSKIGYHTEKIMHAFKNNIIPIYWGDENCKDIFNPEAYINVNLLGINGAIEKIELLNSNLDEYNKMLSQPIFKEDSVLFREEYKKFLSEEHFKNYIKSFVYNSNCSV
jgi:hypothetical protein